MRNLARELPYSPRLHAFDRTASNPKPKYQLSASANRQIAHVIRAHRPRNSAAGSSAGTAMYGMAHAMNGIETDSPCIGRGRLLINDGYANAQIGVPIAVTTVKANKCPLLSVRGGGVSYGSVAMLVGRDRATISCHGFPTRGRA
jgi:hypothetical protein